MFVMIHPALRHDCRIATPLIYIWPISLRSKVPAGAFAHCRQRVVRRMHVSFSQRIILQQSFLVFGGLVHRHKIFSVTYQHCETQ